MVANVISGTVLVLLSWCALVAMVLAIGRPIALWTRNEATTSDIIWRTSLWWGVAAVTGITVAISLVIPLGSPLAAAGLLGLALTAAGVSWILSRPRLPQWDRPSWWVGVWMIAVTGAVLYLATKALGPVTNYDTGLYHLGAIKYASDYSAIPGLANLYFPFGYANAQFPLAAILGNGPWDGIGYRLLNGSVLVIVVADLMSRVLNRRWSWGTFTLLVGISASLLPMVVLSDDMVISPTSDTSVMLLTIASAAYLADSLERRKMRATNAAIAVLLASLTVIFRPTMGVFTIGTLAIVLLVLVRGSSRVHVPARLLAVTIGMLLFLAVSSLTRDALLSGWLVYPLSVLPLSVPWLTMDPWPWRTATLAAARDPGSPDGYVTANSWDWIGAWLTRLPQQWETWFVAMGILTFVVIMWWSKSIRLPQGWRRKLFLVLVPSLLSVTAWFAFSPPSFRFIWGPLFLLLYLPLGMWIRISQRNKQDRQSLGTPVKQLILASAAAIAVATSISLIDRNQFSTIQEPRSWQLGTLTIPYAVTPIPMPATKQVELRSGLVINSPVAGDQCWDNYPLCTYLTSGEIALRGPTLQTGFERHQ